MPKKEKQKVSKVSLIIIFILAAALAICIRHIVTSKDRVAKFENYLGEYYYSQEHLELAMQDTLGDIYGDNIKANFDNYVYKLILDDINEHEPDEIAKYNTIFGIERIPSRNSYSRGRYLHSKNQRFCNRQDMERPYRVQGNP